MSRTIIIGLDGVPPNVLQEYIGLGVMPNLAGLFDTGRWGHMGSSVPAISNVSWTSMFTGENPGVHGIFGFTDFIDGSYTLRFPNRSAIKAQPFWGNGGRHVVVNMPATYPPRPMNGVIISGFVALDLGRAVQPDSVLPMMKQCGYRVDVDASKATSSMSLFYRELRESLMARERVGRYLWDGVRGWDTFTFVVTGTDRLLHYQWDERLDVDAVSYFGLVDEVIGRILSRCREDDRVIMMSDHGMTGITRDVYVNSVLKDMGLLQFDAGKGLINSFHSLDRSSEVFALDPGRIYLHHAHRFPNGHLMDAEIVDQVKNLFLDLRFEGQHVIDHVVEKAEVYRGPEVVSAPDMVLIPHDGFSLRAGLNKSKVFYPPEYIKGMHTPDAFVFCNQDCLPNKIEEVRWCITA